MGDDSTTLKSFLTNIINTKSLTALISQMTVSGTSSTTLLSATLSLTSANLTYLTGNTLDGTNLNKLMNLKNISITGLKKYLSGTDMPRITLSGLSTLDFSDNGMRITQNALDSLTKICGPPTNCTLTNSGTQSNCNVAGLTSNTLTTNLTVCPSTNGDYDDLTNLLKGILDKVSMNKFKSHEWETSKTSLSLSGLSLQSSFSIKPGIKFTNLSIFDISQNDLTITQPEVNSLATLCDSPTKCTLFKKDGNNCTNNSKLTSSIIILTNQRVCSTTPPPTPAAPTPVPQQPTNGDYNNLTNLLEGILSSDDIRTFKTNLISQITDKSETNLSLPSISVLSSFTITPGIKFANLSIFDISHNDLTITQPKVDSLSTLCGDNTTCTLFGSQTTNSNCSLSNLTSSITSLTNLQHICPTTPSPIPNREPPQITGLRIIDGGITLDYIRGFECNQSSNSLPEFFKDPMIGYWYYAYPGMIKDVKPDFSIGIGETNITDDQLINMANTLGLTGLTGPNTYFNLASGAVPYTKKPITGDNQTGMYGNGTYGAKDGCATKQGDTGILQPYPPSAPSGSKYKVLNIGGWGSWTYNKENTELVDKNQPVYWTTQSISLIYDKIDGIMSYMIHSHNNYNVLSIDIEGIHIDNDSQLFGETVTKICQALYTNKLGCMITMPGNGVTNTDPPGKSGMEWFKYVDEQYVTRICLMYYAKINDTENQSHSISDYIRVPFENSLMNCYPREKLILGLSCASEDCKIGDEPLFENKWVQDTFKGGISMWRRYYGTSDEHDQKVFQDPTPPGDMPSCPFDPTPAPPTPAPPTPAPGQPTPTPPAPGQPTPAPPSPAPGQPTPAPPTPGSTSSNWCGSSWGDANTRCHAPCDGTDKACLVFAGEKCYAVTRCSNPK